MCLVEKSVGVYTRETADSFMFLHLRSNYAGAMDRPPVAKATVNKSRIRRGETREHKSGKSDGRRLLSSVGR